MKTKSKLLIIGILSIGLSNTLLAKDYGVINGNYTPPSYNSETLNLSTSLREVPKDTYLKIEKEVEKKYQEKLKKNLKEAEKKIENKLISKYKDANDKKLIEENKKLLEEIKNKDKIINEKEKALSELKTLQNKVQECEKQRIDTESKEIKEKIDKATQKALSEYLSEYSKNREIDYIKNSSKEKSITDNFPSFPVDNNTQPKRVIEKKIEKESFNNDFNLESFKLENLN